MTVIDSVLRASSYQRRIAIAEQADRRQDQAVDAVLADGFDLDWTRILANPDSFAPVDGIEEALRREFKRESFRSTIDTLNLSGRLIATFIQQKHEEDIGIINPAPILTFKEPDLSAPADVLSYWKRILKLTDGEANAILQSVIDSNTDGNIIADRITRELVKRLAALHREITTQRIAQVGTGTPINESDTLAEFIRRARETFPDQSRALLETEYRTRLTGEYGAARHEQILARQATFPFTQFFAIKDTRTTWYCCLPMGSSGPGGTGYVAASDDITWFTWNPPNHYRCFTPDTLIDAKATAAFRMSYTGEIVELQTRNGRVLSVTPNHPIATARGFVAAEMIRKGDHLLCRERDVETRLEMVGAVHEQNRPPRIDDAFHMFGERWPVRRARTAACDFDGDAEFGDGHVDVIAVDGQLLENYVVARAQLLSNFVLETAAAPPLAAHPSVGERDVLGVWPFPADVGPVQAVHPAAPLDSGHVLPPEFILFGATAKFDALCAKVRGDRVPLGAAFFRELIDSCALPIPNGQHMIAQPENASVTARSNASAPQTLADRLDADAISPCERDHGFAGLVVLDDIVEIRRFRYSGHVYDLQTTTGLVIANDILSSNCRATTSPIGYREAQRMGILAADGRTKIAVTGGNPNRPFGDPPRLAVNPENADDVREVKPAPGFGG